MKDYMIDNFDDDLCTKEQMKNEALKRMKDLGIKKQIINCFEKSNKLLCSNYGKITEIPPNILKEIRNWEKQFGNLAYHVIYSELWGFQIYNALSVSCYYEDWDFENEIMKNRWVMAYTINVTKPDFSESGSILFHNYDGILERIG